MLWETCMNWLQDTARSSSITTLIWELQLLHPLLTCTLHSKRLEASAEMESAPSFLAANRWVLKRPISETKSHPHPMRGFGRSALLLTHARCIASARAETGRAPSMGSSGMKTVCWLKEYWSKCSNDWENIWPQKIARAWNRSNRTAGWNIKFWAR
jgi:hypothetical protein